MAKNGKPPKWLDPKVACHYFRSISDDRHVPQVSWISLRNKVNNNGTKNSFDYYNCQSACLIVDPECVCVTSIQSATDPIGHLMHVIAPFDRSLLSSIGGGGRISPNNDGIGNGYLSFSLSHSPKIDIDNYWTTIICMWPSPTQYMTITINVWPVEPIHRGYDQLWVCVCMCLSLADLFTQNSNTKWYLFEQIDVQTKLQSRQLYINARKTNTPYMSI